MLDLGVREVIEQGFCIGCGACTIKSNTAKIVFNQYGELVADINACTENEIKSMAEVCPFSTAAKNETELSHLAFKDQKNTAIGNEVGIFNGLYAGHSNIYRKWGSSGGIVNWLLAQLLTDNKVDKVIVVGASNHNDDRYFDFKVIDNPNDLITTGTSFYYPVSYDKILQYVIKNPGRYAITGVPCFHKALRQIKLVTPIIKERIIYQIGIVCGQMKSAFYLDYLTRKTGANTLPDTACFRRKNESARADEYLFEANFNTHSKKPETRQIGNREIGSNWAMGLFKPRACDFCDDVYAETADIAVMDAWLDRYVNDGKGTSLVVTRLHTLKAMLENGKNTNEIQLEPISEADVVESQRGGLNHRRAGLRYRLFLGSQHESIPKKRVLPSNQLDIWFKIEQQIRARIRTKSRDAMRKQLESGQNGLSLYESDMKGILGLYKWFSRIRNRITRNRNYKSLFKLDL